MKSFNIFILISLVLFSIVVFCYYCLFEKPNFISYNNSQHSYNIYPNTTTDSLYNLLKNDYKIISKKTWDYQCKKSKLSRIKSGHYEINNKIGNRQLIRLLLTNSQVPINLTFTNTIRTKNDLARVIAKQLMLDSLDIINRLNDSLYMKKYGLNQYSSISLFMPNTYNIYWTISPDQLFNKMYEEYSKFWNTKRLEQASILKLTPVEITTIASIVECESNKESEYADIAGLYINRLRKNMCLQACPTVIFAVGDFTLRRVKSEHLAFKSPYNTYINRGLPPGPIRCVKPSSIDKVLNAPQTKILYMCAKDDLSGYHNFSETYVEHRKHATRYQKMLNQRNVK